MASIDDVKKYVGDKLNEFATPAKPATDDWYTEKLNGLSGYSADQMNILRNNPYLIANAGEYVGSGWSDFGDSMGWSNNKVAYYADLKAKANTWYDDRIREFYEQKYNSAPEQAQRLEAAGQNPDLTGGVTPGEAAQNDEASYPAASHNPGNAFNDVVNVLSSTGMSFINTTMSVLQGVNAFRGTSLQNDALSFSLSDDMRNSAEGILRDSITDVFNPNGKDFPDVLHFLDGDELVNLFQNKGFNDALDKAMSNRLRSLPISSRNRKRMVDILNNLRYSNDGSTNDIQPTAFFEQLVNEQKSRLYDSRSGMAKSYGALGANQSSQEGIKVVGETYRVLNDLILECEKANQSASQKIAQNVLDQESVRVDMADGRNVSLGTARGTADANQQSVASALGDVRKRITKAFEEINKKITGNRKLSAEWKLALSAGAAAAEAFAFSKLNSGGSLLPTFNIDRSTNVTNKDEHFSNKIFNYGN